MALSAAQFGALSTLREFGPVKGIEVRQPPAIDGTRKTKLECHLMSAATLARLEGDGLVAVTRGEIFRPVDAGGKAGAARREIQIAITDKGHAAIETEELT